MKPKVYVETTVVSYLTARLSGDAIIAGHQQSTRDWWDTGPNKFQLVASELVVQEASAGDEEAARERLQALDSLTLLETTEEALALAQQLVDASAIPQSHHHGFRDYRPKYLGTPLRRAGVLRGGYPRVGIDLASQWTDSRGRPQSIVTGGGQPIPELT